MNRNLEELVLRLLDLAGKQKAAVEAGNLDEALMLAATRRRLIREIKETGGPAEGGKPSLPVSVLREILVLDGQAKAAAGARLRETSQKLSEINTLRVCCQGVFEKARFRCAPTEP